MRAGGKNTLFQNSIFYIGMFSLEICLFKLFAQYLIGLFGVSVFISVSYVFCYGIIVAVFIFWMISPLTCNLLSSQDLLVAKVSLLRFLDLDIFALESK